MIRSAVDLHGGCDRTWRIVVRWSLLTQSRDSAMIARHAELELVTPLWIGAHQLSPQALRVPLQNGAMKWLLRLARTTNRTPIPPPRTSVMMDAPTPKSPPDNSVEPLTVESKSAIVLCP